VDGVVVVLVDDVVVALDDPSVVVVVDDVVVADVVGVFFDISRPKPVKSSAINTTASVARRGQRRDGREFGELCM
jgi:hypothetical protein